MYLGDGEGFHNEVILSDIDISGIQSVFVSPVRILVY